MKSASDVKQVNKALWEKSCLRIYTYLTLINHTENYTCAGYGVYITFNFVGKLYEGGNAQHCPVQESCYAARWCYWPREFPMNIGVFQQTGVQLAAAPVKGEVLQEGKSLLCSHDSWKMSGVTRPMLLLQTSFQFLSDVHVLQRCCALCWQDTLLQTGMEDTCPWALSNI